MRNRNSKRLDEDQFGKVERKPSFGCIFWMKKNFTQKTIVDIQNKFQQENQSTQKEAFTKALASKFTISEASSKALVNMATSLVQSMKTSSATEAFFEPKKGENPSLDSNPVQSTPTTTASNGSSFLRKSLNITTGLASRQSFDSPDLNSLNNSSGSVPLENAFSNSGLLRRAPILGQTNLNQEYL